MRGREGRGGEGQYTAPQEQVSGRSERRGGDGRGGEGKVGERRERKGRDGSKESKERG